MRVITIITLLTVGLAHVPALASSQQRIVGGTETTIQTYPFSAALLRSSDFITYGHRCGGVVINNRSLLTAAHCPHGDSPVRWRVRLGSTFSNFGGTVFFTSLITVHPSYNVTTRDYDVALLRSASNFSFGSNISSASIAGATFNLADNAVVVAIGWGATKYQGEFSATLRQVQLWTVNQITCRNRYADLEMLVTDNMLCTGWLDVGGRDQCDGDSGSPILGANNVVVGVRSWGQRCGLARYPGVSTRVSRFSAWISSNA